MIMLLYNSYYKFINVIKKHEYYQCLGNFFFVKKYIKNSKSRHIFGGQSS